MMDVMCIKGRGRSAAGKNDRGVRERIKEEKRRMKEEEAAK